MCSGSAGARKQPPAGAHRTLWATTTEGGSPMGTVDDLVANPGLYVGTDTVRGTGLRGAARIVVTPLPGNSGVTLDYEILNPAHPERIRGHVEHTIVARTHNGATIMVIGHPHASSVAILRETDPGSFELGDEPSPFP